MKRLLKLIILIIFEVSNCRADNIDSLFYNMDINELMELNIIHNSDYVLLPDYELSLEDLEHIQIVKNLIIKDELDVSYDMSIEELLEVEMYKNSTIHLIPSYDMPIEGIMKFDVLTKYKITESIDISYDMSLEGLLNITIAEVSSLH